MAPRRKGQARRRTKKCDPVGGVIPTLYPAGESARALRAMTVAAALGPNSRFVVRCAARLFLHVHDTRKALSVIRNAAGSKRDPWLLAAEIAVASASQLPSTLARIGKLRNEDEALSLFERTELSSALATWN